jgi:hypothetical protein
VCLYTEVESATRSSVQTHEGYFSICKDVQFFNLVKRVSVKTVVNTTKDLFLA